MTLRRYTLTPLILAGFIMQSTGAEQDPNNVCADSRERIGEQIKEARLQGDKARRSTLEERLQQLNKHCRGVVPVQPNHLAIEKATREADEREAQLREALGSGDPDRIELSKRRLDYARQQLDAAKR
jgi:stress response protein YsnF